ncbi:unnamed protein product [Urochloa decumbens]|uniref:BTB domain-containing protein n=1 Tax=Urochloa decumbens TaxID=240449 RepID=A0ABC9BR33_9POAL
MLEEDKGYVSIFFDLVSKASVSAIFEVFMMGKDGNPWKPDCRCPLRTDVLLFEEGKYMGGWARLVSQHDLEKYCLKEGHVTFVCAIMVARGSSIPVPAPDIGKHFGALLDSMDGADVSFTIDNETFHAHRAVLAARSPVFKTELLGSMAEATMPNITLHDIAPATFRVMLQFVYTDALPADSELGGSPSEMMKHLLAAADRYALDRLKLICAQKLWEDVSVDSVAATLSFAEMHSCPELKNKCIDFFATGENFKKAVLTKGFVQLVQQFPSIVDDLRKRIGASFAAKDGSPWEGERTDVLLSQGDKCTDGWTRFISQRDLETYCPKEGHVTFVCAIMVTRGSSIPVPAPDIGKHFGALLDSMDGADVLFTIDGDMFRAHRAVLAARSPVFKAELLGSMAEATMPNITLHDIAPATFRVMLQFVYTDALPADSELGGSPSEMMKHLLAAADRYALDRLKLICAQKLWEDVSVDSVAATLSFAEMHSCPELKSKCIEFFAMGENFKKAVLTKGFVQLVQQFPSIVDELREKIGS